MYVTVVKKKKRKNGQSATDPVTYYGVVISDRKIKVIKMTTERQL